MQEALDKAKEEVKRADHLIYVSLKYTRTVDVMKSIIERLVNTFDFCIESLLIKAKKDKKITEVPPRPKQRELEAIKHYDLKDFMEFYELLRKIAKSQCDKTSEYRRHVTMTSHMDEQKIEITIDIITDYFNKTKEFVQFTSEIVQQ